MTSFSPLHDDPQLTDEWFRSVGCTVDGRGPFTLPGAPIEIYRNLIRDKSGRYDGYIVLFTDDRRISDSIAVVRSTQEASAVLREFIELKDDQA